MLTAASQTSSSGPRTGRRSMPAGTSSVFPRSDFTKRFMGNSPAGVPTYVGQDPAGTPSWSQPMRWARVEVSAPSTQAASVSFDDLRFARQGDAGGHHELRRRRRDRVQGRVPRHGGSGNGGHLLRDHVAGRQPRQPGDDDARATEEPVRRGLGPREPHGHAREPRDPRSRRRGAGAQRRHRVPDEQRHAEGSALRRLSGRNGQQYGPAGDGRHRHADRSHHELPPAGPAHR